MFKNLNIGNKLAILIITLTLSVVGIVSLLFYSQFRSAINQRVLLQLNSIMRLKKGQIENQIDIHANQFKTLAGQFASDTIQPGDIRNETFLCISRRSSKDTCKKSFIDKIPPTEFEDSVMVYDLSVDNPKGTMMMGFQMKLNDSLEVVGLSEMLEIQQILYERTGMGQTGESYIVGADRTMRSRSRFFPEQAPVSIAVHTKGVAQGFAGYSGRSKFPDYRNVMVFSAFDKIDVYGLEWVILSELDQEEATEPLQKVKRNLLIILLIVTIAVLSLTYKLSQFLVRPVVSMERRLQQMAKGNIQPQTKSYASNDEIGKMFDALDNLIHTLQQAIQFAEEIGTGNFQAQYNQLSDEDELGRAMIRMREKLKELKRNEEQLIKANQKSLINGEEGERTRISKELHDGIGPLLTSLRMYIQHIHIDEDEKSKLKSMLDETIKEVRRISNNLMPSVLIDFGVGEALRNLVAQMQSYTSKNIKYVNSVKTSDQIPHDVNVAVYRIAQESLHNAIKHSGATEIRMSVSSFKDFINFFISDNGRGFDEHLRHNGSGLRNMKERVHLLNGDFHLETGPNGTKIDVEIPLN